MSSPKVLPYELVENKKETDGVSSNCLSFYLCYGITPTEEQKDNFELLTGGIPPKNERRRKLLYQLALQVMEEEV